MSQVKDWLSCPRIESSLEARFVVAAVAKGLVAGMAAAAKSSLLLLGDFFAVFVGDGERPFHDQGAIFHYFYLGSGIVSHVFILLWNEKMNALAYAVRLASALPKIK